MSMVARYNLVGFDFILQNEHGICVEWRWKVRHLYESERRKTAWRRETRQDIVWLFLAMDKRKCDVSKWLDETRCMTQITTMRMPVRRSNDNNMQNKNIELFLDLDIVHIFCLLICLLVSGKESDFIWMLVIAIVLIWLLKIVRY